MGDGNVNLRHCSLRLATNGLQFAKSHLCGVKRPLLRSSVAIRNIVVTHSYDIFDVAEIHLVTIRSAL